MFQYEVINKKDAERAHLLFTGTGSVMDDVESADIYSDKVNSMETYDLSIYPPTHPNYYADFMLNRSKLRLMKEDIAASPIQEFVRLRPKTYSFQHEERNPDGTTDLMNKHRARASRWRRGTRSQTVNRRTSWSTLRKTTSSTASSDCLSTASTE